MPTITIDKTSHWYGASGPQGEPDIQVIHTTETGAGVPGYAGGGNAPHETIVPVPGKGIKVYLHIPENSYAKALVNLAGGVETNRRGAIQTELAGTCDPATAKRYGYYFWPDADDVVLQALADYLRPRLAKYGIPHVAPRFVSYPDSYGNGKGQRMSGKEWQAFSGIVGHQHVPENVHGDPGAFPIAKLVKFLDAGGKSPAPAKTTSSAPAKTPSLMLPHPAPSIPPFPGTTRQSTRVTGAARAFQARLKARGWSVVVDGVHGPATTAVLKSFQREKGLTPDGVGGPATWKALWSEPVTD